MSKQKRLAIIDKDRCRPKKCNNECKKKCPVEKVGKVCIEIEKVAIISEDICIGCGHCVKVCPFNAIQIVNLPTQLEKNLFFSYGENNFRLYKMPIPKPGQIYGIIGRNGVGKSTILGILSGNLKPNFGKTDGATDSEIIKKIRGTELQKYFKNMGKFVVKSKPQNIELVQRRVRKNKPNLKVGVRIMKLFNKGNPFHAEVVESLDLESLYDKTIGTLSGGEMQRLVCAITLMSDADVYIFDEPTNFLDIKQRLAVASMIQKLCGSKRYVFLVEHDLSILDYTSDYLSIVYGIPAAYGAVSLPHSTGDAINMFFTGYIPSENMKFRPHPFTFKEALTIVADDDVGTMNSFKYPDITVDYGNFLMTAEGGQLIGNTTVVVLMGENGTGKTSFLNQLVKHLDLKVSYKTQYISVDDWKLDGSNNYPTVEELLYRRIRRAMVNSVFKTDVLVPLDIQKILDRKVNKLSGGEQQRVAITLCLGTDADIYFLDEPSASLDIEQRFATTKVLKRFLLHNKKIGFIVEHDMMVSMSLGSEPGAKIVIFKKLENSRSVASKPTPFKSGINRFLEIMDISFRTDYKFRRPRINKNGSQKDREQKLKKRYFI